MDEGETRLNEDGTLALDDAGAILHECTCCTCDACDGSNRVDGRWPQSLSITVIDLFFCRVSCITTSVFSCSGSHTAKLTSGSGTLGTPNTTLKLCLRDKVTNSATQWRALYSCAVTAACRIGIERHTSAGCTSLDPALSAHLFYVLDLTYNASNIVPTITAASRASNVVTITTSANHSRVVGDCVGIAGVTPAGATVFNGFFIITAVPTATTFRYAQTAANDTGTGGTVSIHTIQALPFIYASPISTVPTILTYCPAWSLYSPPPGGTVFKQTPWLKTFTTLNSQNCFVSTSISWGQGQIAFTPCQLV